MRVNTIDLVWVDQIIDQKSFSYQRSLIGLKILRVDTMYYFQSLDGLIIVCSTNLQKIKY